MLSLTNNFQLSGWIAEVKELCAPESIYRCNGIM